MHAFDRASRRGLVGVSLGVLVTAAIAAPPAHAGSAHSRTFGPTGAEQRFTVPKGVTRLHLVVVGGHGGPGIDPGGSGAVATADLAVKSGEHLYVEVGGNGSNAGATAATGGFNGGAASGESNYTGGSGGGASDVRTVPRAAAGTLSSREVVAGGGGGGGGGTVTGHNVHGGDAGQAGGGATPYTAPSDGAGGGGATSATPGTGGAGQLAGASGTVGVGGAGGGDNSEYQSCGSGGGGGGGLAGGGGGGSGGDNECSARHDGGGGGGGSSGFGPKTTHSTVTADATAEAHVTITYSIPRPATRITRSRIRPGSATFSFKATGAVTKFQCALAKKHRAAHYKTCHSPMSYHRLADGSYTFKVRAVGPGGPDLSPAHEHFTSKR